MVSEILPETWPQQEAIEAAMDLGRKLGQDIHAGQNLSELQFETPVSVKSQ